MGIYKNSLSLYIFVAVLFIVGALFGSLLVYALSFEQQQDLATDMEQYLHMMQANAAVSAQESFWDRLLFHSKWLLLLWVLGITVIGLPGVLALNFLKGALIGFTFSTLIQQYAWKGVVLTLLSVAPQNLLIVPAMIMTSVSALSFSIFVVKNRLLQQQGALLPQLLAFSSTALFMLFIYACAAFVEAYLSPALIRWGAPLVLAVAGVI